MTINYDGADGYFVVKKISEGVVELYLPAGDEKKCAISKPLTLFFLWLCAAHSLQAADSARAQADIISEVRPGRGDNYMFEYFDRKECRISDLLYMISSISKIYSG